MELTGKVTVVTGGGGGLGRAVCRRFAGEGARVVLVDTYEQGVKEVAREVDGVGVVADVRTEAGILRTIEEAQAKFGPIDLFFSNAGGGPRQAAGERQPEDTTQNPDAVWLAAWQLHLMAHVYAARALLPAMLERGEGYLLSTASGAALTCEPSSVTYTVTKHASLAFAEWLAISYRDRGIRVSCFCPYGMLTPMLVGNRDISDISKLPKSQQVGLQGAITPEQAADAVIEGIWEERFLILSHPEARTFFQRKASDHDRWLAGMRRLYAPQLAGVTAVDL